MWTRFFPMYFIFDGLLFWLLFQHLLNDLTALVAFWWALHSFIHLFISIQLVALCVFLFSIQNYIMHRLIGGCVRCFFFFLPILIHVIKLNSKRMIRMNSVQYLTVKMIIVYAVPLDMNSISWKCNRQTSSTYRHRFTWKQSQSGKLVRTKDSNNIQNHSLKTIPLFLRVYLFVNW